MLTSRISIAVPGTFEPNRVVIPSSGWIRSTSAFCVSSSVDDAPNGERGARLKATGTPGPHPPRRHHGAAQAQPLAGAQVEGHPRPAAAVDAELRRRVRLGGGACGDPLLLAEADHL